LCLEPQKISIMKGKGKKNKVKKRKPISPEEKKQRSKKRRLKQALYIGFWIITLLALFAYVCYANGCFGGIH